MKLDKFSYLYQCIKHKSKYINAKGHSPIHSLTNQETSQIIKFMKLDG